MGEKYRGRERKREGQKKKKVVKMQYIFFKSFD